MWIGAGTGLAIATVIGIVFIVLYYVANNSIFTGNAEYLFKGFIYYLAVLLVVYVSFHMLKFYNLEKKWKYKLEKALQERNDAKRNQRYTIAFLAGSATLREGVEAVLFLTGVSGGIGIANVIIPGIIGGVLGLIAGVLIFYFGKSIRSLKWFFIIMTTLLLFIAAGMLMNGTAQFTAAGWFGITYPYEWAPWCNQILWNTMGCCNPNTSEWWSLVQALFGYQPMPTNLQLLYYCLFWFIVLSAMAYRAWLGVLTDKDKYKDVDMDAPIQLPASFADQLKEGKEGESGREASTSGSDTDRNPNTTADKTAGGMPADAEAFPAAPGFPPADAEALPAAPGLPSTQQAPPPVAVQADDAKPNPV